MIPLKSSSQDLDAIVLGRAGMDLYPTPHGSKTAEAETFISDLGGSAGNIAVALARHGLAIGLAAPVSDDPVGRFVQNKVRHYGLTHLTPKPVKGVERTSLALAESRSSDCEVVIYRNSAADFVLSPETFDLNQLNRSPVLIATGTALAVEPSRSHCLSALAQASYSVLDLDYRNYSWPSDEEARKVYLEACATCQMIVGNDEEFALLAGPEGDGKALAQSMAAEQPGRLVVYKMGGQGSVTFHSELASNGFETPIFPVEVLKPFGAGDAFMGGLISALVAGQEAHQAVRFGSAAAAMVVSRLGCASAMPTTDDVSQFIAVQEGS